MKEVSIKTGEPFQERVLPDQTAFIVLDLPSPVAEKIQSNAIAKAKLGRVHLANLHIGRFNIATDKYQTL